MAASSRSATNPWYAAGRRSHGGHQRAPDTRYDASKRKQPAAVEGESRRAAATRSAPVTMAHALVRRTKATAAIAGQMRTAPTKARLVAPSKIRVCQNSPRRIARNPETISRAPSAAIYAANIRTSAPSVGLGSNRTAMTNATAKRARRPMAHQFRASAALIAAVRDIRLPKGRADHFPIG